MVCLLWHNQQSTINPSFGTDLEHFLASLLALDEAQRLVLLKTKSSKEIAQIQAHLENLPLAQQIPIKKAIKQILEELDTV
ncbi:hypothetical protein HHE01_03110 [Helicobacter heilmannii]|uniref:Uncharacterized protein n=3 Tax=Helicobacter heilmannii TaxID=35817 RepID=A0A0K2Y8X6_HELHE|nr:hypothetical protein HHE01_03110 [Helicobacter heilmannii]